MKMQINMQNPSHTSLRQIENSGMPYHWATRTSLQSHPHTLNIFSCMHFSFTNTRFILNWTRLMPLLYPSADNFPWRCISTFSFSPYILRNSHWTATIDLFIKYCSTQKIRCCTGQRSMANWIHDYATLYPCVCKPILPTMRAESAT